MPGIELGFRVLFARCRFLVFLSRSGVINQEKNRSLRPEILSVDLIWPPVRARDFLSLVRYRPVLPCFVLLFPLVSFLFFHWISVVSKERRAFWRVETKNSSYFQVVIRNQKNKCGQLCKYCSVSCSGFLFLVSLTMTQFSRIENLVLNSPAAAGRVRT